MICLNLQNVDFLLKGFCILRSVTRIMVKTYNCSCNRNMYLWWCSFFGFCLGILDSNVQLGVGKFGCIWREWFARGQWIWRQIFEKCQIPTPCPASPPPPLAGFTLIGALFRNIPQLTKHSSLHCREVIETTVLFNDYSSSPSGLWVNSPWGQRPNGLLTQRPWGQDE